MNYDFTTLSNDSLKDVSKVIFTFCLAEKFARKKDFELLKEAFKELENRNISIKINFE